MWLQNFNAGHGRISNLIADPVFDMPRDRLIPEINFTRHFEAVWFDRTDWLNGWPSGLPVEGYIGFTDGSKMSEGTGTGVYIPKLDANDSFRLSGLYSVFQAEVYGMLMGCMKMLPDDVSGKEVVYSPRDPNPIIVEARYHLLLVGYYPG